MKCPDCGSRDQSWTLVPTKTEPVMDGRLRMHDIKVVGVLGCNECSGTVRVLEADEVEAVLNSLQTISNTVS